MDMTTPHHHGHVVKFEAELKFDGSGYKVLNLKRTDIFYLENLENLDPATVPEHLRDDAIFPELNRAVSPSQL